jgi:hypothetical protein
MAVFKMDKSFDVVLNKDAVKLVPELTGLSKDQLKYVILVADYVDSPLRKRPLEERKAMAARMVYGDGKNIETDKIKLAIESYRSLVFDIRRETIDIFKQKIKVLQKEVIMPDISFSRMKEIDQTITFMQDRVASIEHQLDIEEGEEIEIKGGKVLSYLEKWQRSQREYNKFKKSN